LLQEQIANIKTEINQCQDIIKAQKDTLRRAKDKWSKNKSASNFEALNFWKNDLKISTDKLRSLKKKLHRLQSKKA
jgi:hypothetical protein